MITDLHSIALPASVRIRNSGPLGRAEHLEALDHLAEMEGRMERLDLLHQIVDQLLPGDDREAGNVVDRLLRIEFGALAAGARQNVDEMAPDVEQAEFEHGEQADRAGADDRRRRWI